MKEIGTTRRGKQLRRPGRTAALGLALIVGSVTVPLLVASPAFAATIDCFGGTALFLGMLLMSLPMLLLTGRGSRREPQTVRVKA